MKLKKITPVILLFACVLLVQGVTAVFNDWDGTLPPFLPGEDPSDAGLPRSGDHIFPDLNGTTPRAFNETPFGPFGDRIIPDRNATKSWYFLNDTPIRPGSGDHIFPGWNGTKPRFSFNETPFGPFGNRVIPDWNGTKARFFFNDTPFTPGSGNGMMPGWNGRKPSFFFDESGDGPKMGSKVFA
jgi:hypothetical protein